MEYRSGYPRRESVYQLKFSPMNFSMDASQRQLQGPLNIPHRGHDDVPSESSQWLAWAAYDENENEKG